MDKKTLILLAVAIALVIGVLWVLFFSSHKKPLSNPSASKQITNLKVTPSTTLKTYTDPSGFTFNYPDNLSLISNEATNSSTYADIKLTQKNINGSLNLKIADSKFSTLDEWLKSNSSPNSKEAKLGNLKALEVTTKDKILLHALDSGVLFTMEIPFADKKDFWMDVYSKVSQDFSFAQPANAASQTGSADVTLEGEDVVED